MRKLLIGLGFLFVFISIVAIFQNSSKATATPTAEKPAVLPPANPVQVAKCQKVLEYGRQIGALKSYQSTGDGRGTVVVGPSFDSATFENKQALDATVRCVLSQGRENYSGLEYVGYLDPYTNKEVAKWSVFTGFSVD